jgi:gluconolactonase
MLTDRRPTLWPHLPLMLGLLSWLCCHQRLAAQPLPPTDQLQPLLLLTVPSYCEGVVFDQQGRGYISWGDTITQFTLDGEHRVWAVTGAPNGHKVLPDGTHLVCDASRHAVLHLAADGQFLGNAADTCQGTPLRGPNDLCLDLPNRGFYFTDPGDSSREKPDGTVHYVDADGIVHLIDHGLAYPNGIVLTPDGQRLYLAESQTNSIWFYNVQGPGQVGERKLLAKLPVKDEAAGQIDNQPDGMCLDKQGRLYVAHFGMRQVQVLSPEGELVASLPGGNLTTSNVAFGGDGHQQLFITGAIGDTENRGGLFRLDLNVTGLRLLPAADEKSPTTP